MENIWEWGLEVIRIFQSIQSPFLTGLVRFITHLGAAPAYIVLLCIILWTVDYKKGFRLGFVLLFSASLNNAIKSYLNVPRPYTRDPSVGLSSETSSSTPSGHSQNSAAFWSHFSYLNPKLKKVLALTIAFAFPLLIGLTRIYLGVHYPTDVLMGWGIGFAVSIYAILFAPLVTPLLNRLPKIFKILTAALLVVLFNILSPEDTSMQAALFGLCLGFILLCENKGFNAKSGSIPQKIIRTLIGLAVVAALYYGLKLVFPGEDSAQYQAFRFIRYALVGFFTSFVLPKLFILLKTAEPLQE